MADARAEKLNNTLSTFNIKAKVCNVVYGTQFARYEVELEPTQKLKPLVSLAGDIELAFGIEENQVRISTVLGKAYTAGIEMPYRSGNSVSLSEITNSGDFQSAESKTTFAIGKTVDGKIILGDIAELPHLQIGGGTGSGKSVFLNVLIKSLLQRATPDDIRFVMIDPKKVELSHYKNIPHLLAPIIKDSQKAMVALEWVANEMERRYDLGESLGAREFKRLNMKLVRRGECPLPRIIVVIDEMSDLMMTFRPKSAIERNGLAEVLCRIAQKARASGIHLVVATQRPSKEVIPPIVKDNLLSKIAFAVNDGVASRIAIDELGAERLLGKGDFLLKKDGERTIRGQSAFESDDDLEDFLDRISVDSIDYDDGLIAALNAPSAEEVAAQEEAQKRQVAKDMYKNIIVGLLNNGENNGLKERTKRGEGPYAIFGIADRLT